MNKDSSKFPSDEAPEKGLILHPVTTHLSKKQEFSLTFNPSYPPLLINQ